MCTHVCQCMCPCASITAEGDVRILYCFVSHSFETGSLPEPEQTVLLRLVAASISRLSVSALMTQAHQPHSACVM